MLALVSLSYGQTNITVMADTNRVIRTNYTIAAAQVIGAVTNVNMTNAVGTLAIANGGTGATNASLAISNLLPAYSTNTNAVLGLNTNATALVWRTNVGGTADLTNVTGVLAVTNGGTGGTNTESAVLGLGILNTNNYSVNLFYGGTNASNQHIVIGAYANAYGTNINEHAVVIGYVATASNNGVAIGYASQASSGISFGYNAFSEGRGIAIGTGANSQGGSLDDVYIFGGVAVGASSYSDTNNGVAVGTLASTIGNGAAIGWGTDARGGTNGGVAIGYFADTYEGIAIGVNAAANNGVAIGANAVDNNEGVAIGIRANTVNGAAIGIDAASDVGYQIGTGTNGESMEPTIQFMDAGEVYTNQWTALANSTALGHANMAAIVATNSPANTNAPSPDAWMLITEGTNNYYLPLWQ